MVRATRVKKHLRRIGTQFGLGDSTIVKSHVRKLKPKNISGLPSAFKTSVMDDDEIKTLKLFKKDFNSFTESQQVEIAVVSRKLAQSGETAVSAARKLSKKFNTDEERTRNAVLYIRALKFNEDFGE